MPQILGNNQRSIYKKVGAIVAAFLAVVTGYIIVTSYAATTVAGLSATYYDNADFSGTSVSRVDPQINFNWGTGSPDSKIANTTYSARWTGDMVAPTTGVYQISTSSDDGVRVWIGDQQIINSWTIHGSQNDSGSLNLVAGQKYPVKVEFFQQSQGASLSLLWSGPGIKKVVIPASAFTTTLGDAPAPAQTQLINDSFTSNTLGSYVTSGGAWAIAGGTLNLSSPLDSGTQMGNGNLLIHKQILSGDFTLGVEGKSIDTASIFNDFSVVFGYKDSSNYYYASFNETNDTQTNGLFKVVNGVQTELADFALVTAPGAMHKVGVKRSGTTLTVNLDGTNVATVNDSTYTVGQVGVGSRNDSAVFDNLIVSGTSGGMVAIPTPVPTPAPTPTPAATPTPTPGPVGSTTCALPKYPSASCTGVPAGITLTTISGDVTLSAGQTLDGKKVTGNVIVDGNGVVIKNSEIYGTVRGSQSAPPSYTITDSTVGPTSGCNGDAALAFANYTATRVHIRNFGDGPRDSGNNILIQDSFIKTCSNPGDHADGFQGYLGGTNVRVIHNTIDVRASHPDVTAPLFAADSSAGIVAQDNLIAGGSFSIRFYGSGFTVTNNRIVNNAWMFGPVASDCGGNNWSGNTLVNIDASYNVTSTVGPQGCVQG